MTHEWNQSEGREEEVVLEKRNTQREREAEALLSHDTQDHSPLCPYIKKGSESHSSLPLWSGKLHTSKSSLSSLNPSSLWIDSINTLLQFAPGG